MTWTIAITAGILFGAGTYLILQRLLWMLPRRTCIGRAGVGALS